MENGKKQNILLINKNIIKKKRKAPLSTQEVYKEETKANPRKRNKNHIKP
jgi:hypothetical protein